MSACCSSIAASNAAATLGKSRSGEKSLSPVLSDAQEPFQGRGVLRFPAQEVLNVRRVGKAFCGDVHAPLPLQGDVGLNICPSHQPVPRGVDVQLRCPPRHSVQHHIAQLCEAELANGSQARLHHLDEEVEEESRSPEGVSVLTLPNMIGMQGNVKPKAWNTKPGGRSSMRGAESQMMPDNSDSTWGVDSWSASIKAPQTNVPLLLWRWT
eukprot:CAMPEP_0171078514 /NCGR_PEP_ID=MMETSP0766_2-20121228/14687_1 /TAXON_ID=439317 /ORGANISM="Gambierdiscus australes, Strain CAWD 149" /LENGTH=209 /DNA_ID=CAMNT_0011535649 /DNA_START=34 /DNA_END=664 /DNA_ORIENTATION=+